MAELRGPDSTDDTDAVLLARAPSYAEYLRLPALLALQTPLAQPAVRDELLFIIVHQTHELWFKQILCELSVLIDDIDGGRLGAACRTLERGRKIARLLAEHLQVLETMPVEEFQRFRSVLGTASGLESEQFQRFEKLAGLAPKAIRSRPSTAANDVPSASVREAFWRAVAAHAPSLGRIPRAGIDPEAFGRALVVLLAQPALALQLGLAEALLAFDHEIVLWRRRHVELARVMLGNAAGTGGSSGAAYLRSTMDRSFFPELWHWRTAAAASAGAASL